VPPATTERRRFLREGVTAASAARGEAIMAPAAAVTPAMIFSCVLNAVRICQRDNALLPDNQPGPTLTRL
jgi:hypothetical protein